MKLEIRNICKSYGEMKVLDHLDLLLDDVQPYCLMAPSGSGKTTLFRILLGLEKADEGTVCFRTNEDKPCMTPLLSAVFQEDRLCETFTPIENIQLVTGHTLSVEQIRQELAMLLPEESLARPVATLSGGMKRRVAIVRAILAPSQLIIMDEPFTGLDEDTNANVINYIKEKTSDKLLLISTHHEKDAKLLGARIIEY